MYTMNEVLVHDHQNTLLAEADDSRRGDRLARAKRLNRRARQANRRSRRASAQLG